MNVDYQLGVKPAAKTILQSNPVEAIVSAINERLFESNDALHQQAQLRDISFHMRQAFSFDPLALPQLPIQLGYDYNKASDYVQRAVRTWLESNDLAAFFAHLGIDDATAAGVRNLLWTSVHVQPVANWLCTEFGGIRTTRQAQSARRFVAIKLTNEAIDLPAKEAEPAGDVRAARQAQLDVWTDLQCPAQNSLHYRTVIAPLCQWLINLEAQQDEPLTGLPVANEPMPFVETPQMTPAPAYGGRPIAVASEVPLDLALAKGARTVAS